MHHLYSILLPQTGIEEYIYEMFLRASQNTEVAVHNGTVAFAPAGGGFAELSFDTYFNAFSIAKWRKYTELKNLSLQVSLQGTCEIVLFAVDAQNLERELALHEFSFSDAKPDTTILTFPEIPEDAVLVFWKIRGQQQCVLHSAAYLTEIDRESIRSVDLSIVICTYKREEYVLKTLADIDKAMQIPALAGKIEVRLVDNGQTLKPELAPELFAKPWLHLFSNLNTGGSGGFARGMLETLDAGERNEQQATHVLLMDDDIELPDGVLEKSFAILQLVKGEYKDAFIGGAMLNLDERNIQVAGEEFFQGPFLLYNEQADIDLTLRTSLLQNDTPTAQQKKQYQCWWYCLVPMSIVRQKGLAYPFFFQWDDLEYSARADVSIIHMNSIAAWHEAFYKKSQNSKYFFIIRNGLIFCAVREEYLFPVCMRFAKQIVGAMVRSHYNLLSVINNGFEAFLAGPGQLTEASVCTAQLRDQSKWNDHLVDLKEALGEIPQCATPDPEPVTAWDKFISLLTLNGHIFPNIFLGTVAYRSDIPVHWSELRYKHTVVFVDQDGKNGAVYKQSFLELAKQVFALGKNIGTYLLRRKRINAMYQAEYKRMVSAEFWREYLKL